jgi:hypothetical protein
VIPERIIFVSRGITVLYILAYFCLQQKRDLWKLYYVFVVPEIILKEQWMSVMKLDVCFLLGDCFDFNKPFHAGIKYLR